MQVSDGSRTLNAVIIGSPNVNPGYILVNNRDYPQIAGDYVKIRALHGCLSSISRRRTPVCPGPAISHATPWPT